MLSILLRKRKFRIVKSSNKTKQIPKNLCRLNFNSEFNLFKKKEQKKGHLRLFPQKDPNSKMFLRTKYKNIT